MMIHEPTTFATDCVLAIFSVGVAWRLRSAVATRPARHWWSRAFFCTSLASLSGGIFHGFGPAMPAAYAAALWYATLLALNATSLALMQAAAHMAFDQTALRFWRQAAWIKAGVFASLTLMDPVFLSAIADYGASLTFLLVVELRFWRRHAAHARWMVAGVTASALAAVVQQLRLAPSPHFNHNDLYHVIELTAFAFFYRGAQQL
jgi:hypothetical protein